MASRQLPNTQKIIMATLRGSRESILTATAETLKLVLKFETVADLKSGIRAVINSLEKDRDKFKKK
jgi:hypothetical protein